MTESFAAFSSISCTRFVLSVSEWTRSVLPMLVPNCSDCTSIETRLRITSTSGAIGQVLPGVGAGTSRALFQGHDAQLVAQIRLRLHQLFGGARRGLVQAEAGLDADDKQIEHIRQVPA